MIDRIENNILDELTQADDARTYRTRDAVLAVLQELSSAREAHGPMHSAHEGYAVIKEELDEAWDEIKNNKIASARAEMIQVGAMALRFLVDVQPEAGEEGD